ncbi:MAG: hypothetical protein HPY50_13125 [Firmicutes bacterium]|nr:hypothetical protein [Bacillota bacterium]
MKVGSDIVGLRFKEYQTRITLRQTTNYAAAVGDMNPRYLDDRREGGVVAPPMLAVAVSWPIVENIKSYLDLPYPPEIFNTIVHYSEYLEITRPLRPGDRVTVSGEVLALIPHKAGSYIVFKFSVTDKDGKAIHQEYTGGILRGVECTDGGKGEENIPMVPDHAASGDPEWSVTVPITPEAPYVYDGCTNIYFPIHTSPKFAKAVGLPGIIYQGTATLALAVCELINREAGGDPERVKVIFGRFTGMVMPDSAIAVQLQGRRASGDYTELFFRVLNQQEKEAISLGYAKIGR